MYGRNRSRKSRGPRQSRSLLSVCGQGSPRGGPSDTQIDAEVPQAKGKDTTQQAESGEEGSKTTLAQPRPRSMRQQNKSHTPTRQLSKIVCICSDKNQTIIAKETKAYKIIRTKTANSAVAICMCVGSKTIFDSFDCLVAKNRIMCCVCKSASISVSCWLVCLFVRRATEEQH